MRQSEWRKAKHSKMLEQEVVFKRPKVDGWSIGWCTAVHVRWYVWPDGKWHVGSEYEYTVEYTNFLGGTRKYKVKRVFLYTP